MQLLVGFEQGDYPLESLRDYMDYNRAKSTIAHNILMLFSCSYRYGEDSQLL